MAQLKRYGLLMCFALVILLGAITVATPTAHAAVTCYGDYCSGKDPMATGCANDATTIEWLDLSGARLELRWSRTCKTEWARWIQYPVGMKSDIPTSLSAVQDTGYTQSRTYDVNGPGQGMTWTNMIYSPIHLVKAVATLQCGDISLFGTAMDCAMNGKVQTTAA